MGWTFAVSNAFVYLLVALGQHCLAARHSHTHPAGKGQPSSLALQLAGFSTLSTGLALAESSQLGVGRELLEAPAQALALTTPTPGPAAAQSVGAGNGDLVIFIQNTNPAFLDSACVDACSQGFTCAAQNAWAWLCQGTNLVDHMWVWQASGLIRLAANDSFARNPELCLDMCEDFSLGRGSCSLTLTSGYLNVGYQECTARPNQVLARLPFLPTPFRISVVQTNRPLPAVCQALERTRRPCSSSSSSSSSSCCCCTEHSQMWH